jgi:hypothetical protein
MSLVKDVVVEFYDSGQWIPYACARSATFTSVTELIETTVTGSGQYKNFLPTVNSFTGNIDGIVSLGVTNNETLYTLRQYQLGHVLQRVRFVRSSVDGLSTYTDTVDFYITNVSDTSSFDNINTFTVELQGTGVIDQSIIQPPIIITKVKRYEYTATGGELGFADPVLINKDILEVNKDGLGNSKIVTVGSPASKECKYTTGTGQFEWAVLFDAGEEAYILYQDL